MPAAAGRNFVIYTSTDAGSTWQLVGGLLSTGFTINNEPVDITSKESNGVRELLANAGITSITVSGSGVYKASTSEGVLATAAAANTHVLLKLESGTGTPTVVLTGSWMVASYERNGEHNGAQQYSVTLESAGAITVNGTTRTITDPT